MLLAAGLPLISWGLVYHQGAWGKALIVAGVVTVFGGAIGWGIEPLFGEEEAEEAVE